MMTEKPNAFVAVCGMASMAIMAVAFVLSIGLGVQTYADHKANQAWNAAFDSWAAYNRNGRDLPVTWETWKFDHR